MFFQIFLGIVIGNQIGPIGCGIAIARLFLGLRIDACFDTGLICGTILPGAVTVAVVMIQVADCT